MRHKLLEQLHERVEISKSESDFTYFFSLLLFGEAIAKTITLGLLAAIEDDTSRNRYRLEYQLVRANGMGDWSTVIADALSGPASQYLIGEAQQERTELTKNCSKGEWQYDAVSYLKQALVALHVDAEDLPNRSDMKRWFRLFSTLRNKTRAHGATRPEDASDAAPHLFKSIDLICESFHLFRRPWVYLHRNLSGKYRVTTIGDDTEEFDNLKREANHSLQNGVYIHFGSPSRAKSLY